MKILFCLGSMTKGGAERVIANLTNYLVNEYYISIVVTPPDESSYELDKRINFYTLDKKEDKKNGIIKRNIRRIVRLKRIIKEDNPNIIVSLLPEPTYRVMFLNLFLRKKVIISVRNDPNVEYNNIFKKILVKLLYSRANGFIFQTEDAKMFFSKKIQDKSIIIPNPIADEFIVEPFNGKRKNKIVSVGRLTKQKNQLNLIKAFFIFEKKYSDYKLYIYGEGELHEELDNEIKKMNLNNKVFLEGNVNDIKNRIYDSKMFVLSSDYEGMPNALMEAMALGIPCISTNCPCGGPKFLIKDKQNGLLVPVNDIDALEKTMEYIADNELISTKMGISANKIGKELNCKQINKRWIDYILKIEKER